MPRVYIIGGILAVALMIYGLVDLTVTDDRRIRRLNRILWIVLIVLLPVVGPLAWLFWGKAPIRDVRPIAPDDDPSLGRGNSGLSDSEADRRIRDLEAQLKALDDEERQGEQPSTHPEDDADKDAGRA